MARVTLEHVTKRYREVVALRDFSLDVADGEIVMLIGPSGCGKTTALRLIAGLETPDAGCIYFDGEDVTTTAPPERNVAMVFEGYALYPHLAVRDNLSFALSLRQVPKAQIGQRVAEVAEAMELGHLLGRQPAGLATGEAQSVAVGRAVIRDGPSVLLLDDALSHLDAQQRLEARTEVGRLHRDLGCTIVSVTHDQAEALAVGTRIAVMDGGTLQQVGTPRGLYQQPANLFVAGFIGDPPMNLVHTTVEWRDGSDVLVADGLELPLSRPVGARGRGVMAGIRPEHIQLTSEPGEGEGEGEGVVSGRCELVEYLGDELLVHVRVGGSEVIVRDDPTCEVSAGDIVDCVVPRHRLRLFDADTGRAIS